MRREYEFLMRIGLVIVVAWLLAATFTLAGRACAMPISTFEVEVYATSPFSLSLDYGTGQAMAIGPIYFFPVTIPMAFDPSSLSFGDLPSRVDGFIVASGLHLGLTLYFEGDPTARNVFIFEISSPQFNDILLAPIIRATRVPEPGVLAYVLLSFASVIALFIAYLFVRPRKDKGE